MQSGEVSTLHKPCLHLTVYTHYVATCWKHVILNLDGKDRQLKLKIPHSVNVGENHIHITTTEMCNISK